ncbi:metal-dependent hydrolase [Candidatus Nitrospira bockiana]
MASAFSHAAVAIVLGKASFPRGLPARFWWLSIACSILPDVDVLGFAFGIPYEHLLGHRGVTHSLVFAGLVAWAVVQVWFPDRFPRSPRRRLLYLHFFLATASHGALDAMTDGGLGVAFLAPFDDTRYFFPWRPILVSPIGVEPFFSRYGIQVLASELLYVWLPAGAVAAAVALVRARRGRMPNG